ncbi:MAG: N-acetyltransferase [Prevotellaceae bacterium]|jgi:GNAT superfamily N-acetyltransferase|nr:N-acetyltransferase [Prevotellaceae bacterium]
MEDAQLTIKKVSGKKELKKFILFPFKLYKNNKYWVPPLISDEIKTLTAANPAHDFCDVALWLAYRNDEIVGRIAGIINNRANETWDKKDVRFGWFDFIDDIEVSRLLIETVIDWAKSKEMTSICGPLGFTDMDYEGILINGFDQISTMSTIYNYPYYSQHLETQGFEKAADWIEYKIFIPESIPDKHKRVTQIVRDKFGLNIKKYTDSKKLVADYGQAIFDLVNEAYAPLYGYVPLNQKQIDYYIKSYLPMINLKMVTLITDDAGNLLGVGISMPSLAKALQKSKGRMLPFGWYHLLKALRCKNNKVLDLLIVAIKPEYQNKGVNALLFYDLIPVYQQLGFEYAESNPELEMNEKVQSQWEYFETQQHKRRRAFVKNIQT